MKWWFQTCITPCPVYSLLMTTHSILHHSQLSLHYMNRLSPFKNTSIWTHLQNGVKTLAIHTSLTVPQGRLELCRAVPHHHGQPRRPSKQTTRSLSTNKLVYSNLLHYTIKTCRSTCENCYKFFNFLILN